jgi:hypothetical protein
MRYPKALPTDLKAAYEEAIELLKDVAHDEDIDVTTQNGIRDFFKARCQEEADRLAIATKAMHRAYRERVNAHNEVEYAIEQLVDSRKGGSRAQQDLAVDDLKEARDWRAAAQQQVEEAEDRVARLKAEMK